MNELIRKVDTHFGLGEKVYYLMYKKFISSGVITSIKITQRTGGKVTREYEVDSYFFHHDAIHRTLEGLKESLYKKLAGDIEGYSND